MRGYYYFFFDGQYLAKARFYTRSNGKTKSYKYSTAENKLGKAISRSEIINGLPNHDKQTILSAALGLRKISSN